MGTGRPTDPVSHYQPPLESGAHPLTRLFKAGHWTLLAVLWSLLEGGKPMVDVKWHLAEEVSREAAEAALGGVLLFHQQALAGLTCPVHQQEPWLRVQGRTIQNLGVTVETCCRELLDRTHARIGAVSRRHQE